MKQFLFLFAWTLILFPTFFYVSDLFPLGDNLRPSNFSSVERNPFSVECVKITLGREASLKNVWPDNGLETCEYHFKKTLIQTVIFITFFLIILFLTSKYKGLNYVILVFATICLLTAFLLILFYYSEGPGGFIDPFSFVIPLSVLLMVTGGAFLFPSLLFQANHKLRWIHKSSQFIILGVFYLLILPLGFYIFVSASLAHHVQENFRNTVRKVSFKVHRPTFLPFKANAEIPMILQENEFTMEVKDLSDGNNCLLVQWEEGELYDPCEGKGNDILIQGSPGWECAFVSPFLGNKVYLLSFLKDGINIKTECWGEIFSKDGLGLMVKIAESMVPI